MSLIHSVIFGMIEGITEFLPVSSTAHLILASSVLKISQTPFHTFFEVFIQGGAIISVLPLFVAKIIKERKLLLMVIFSFFPTAIIGFLSHRTIKDVFFSEINLITLSLIFIGIVFIIIEILIKKGVLKIHKDIINLTVFQAVLIGLAQSIAVIPGVSRAGIVMITMMLMGYKRSESALYSFYLAVPTILSASLFDLIKTDINSLKDLNNIIMLTVGTLVSFITAFIVVRLFIRFLQSRTLIPFGIYRILTGIFFLI